VLNGIARVAQFAVSCDHVRAVDHETGLPPTCPNLTVPRDRHYPTPAELAVVRSPAPDPNQDHRNP
jgi:hypothetical protein